MPKRAALIEAEIDRRLATVASGLPSRLTGPEVRDLARDYLREQDEYEREFPGEDGSARWTLFMGSVAFDAAHFVVLIFRPDCIEAFSGTGNSFTLRRFISENDPDVDSLFAIMSAQFDIPQPPLRIERRAAALWLGRGWKPDRS